MHIKIDPTKLVLLPVDQLKPHPKNRNKHSEQQIDRLCSLIKYQGFRQPIIVSNRSGLIVVGHGRLEAAKKLKLTHVPVLFQDFDSEEQEYAFCVSDNAIASWAELDLSGINSDLPDLGPDFDIDLLGIQKFSIEPSISECELPILPDGDKQPFQQMTFTLHDDQAAEVSRAIEIAKNMGAFVNTGNENSNGNALARVCEIFVGSHGNG